MRFIKVNKKIMEYKQYTEEVEWLREDIKKKIFELFKKNFEVLQTFEESYDSQYMLLYNSKLDMQVEIELYKREEEKFV